MALSSAVPTQIITKAIHQKALSASMDGNSGYERIEASAQFHRFSGPDRKQSGTPKEDEHAQLRKEQTLTWLRPSIRDTNLS